MNKYYQNIAGKWFVNAIIANHDGMQEKSAEQYADFLFNARKPTANDLLADLTDARKEQERQGVTVNGTRYGGEPENRQALQEAISFMNDAGLTEFPSWKDSDNEFHDNHPLSDVFDAYRAIGVRRSQLIATEGQYAAQIIAGTLTDLNEVTWP